MKSVVFTAVLGLAAIASPAMAQDETSLTGPYIGAYVGYDHVTISDGTDDGSKDGAAFGALLGYNLDLGSAVVGIEGEFGDASTQQEESSVFVAGDNLVLAANRDLFLGARIGFKAAPNALVYAKGGYANTRINLVYDDHAGTSFNGSDELEGYRIGGGVEYFFNGHIGIRGEYRYSDYKEYEYLGTATGLTANRHQVILGLVGQF